MRSEIFSDNWSFVFTGEFHFIFEKMKTRKTNYAAV
jgi:hypothetical protein